MEDEISKVRLATGGRGKTTLLVVIALHSYRLQTKRKYYILRKGSKAGSADGRVGRTRWK